MIQPLRAWHRRAFTALAVVLPVTFGAALLVRPHAPPRLGEPAALGEVIYESKSGWQSHAITTRIRLAGADRVVELVPERDLLQPDVLLYLTATQPAKSLPEDARLLGPFRSGASYPLPLQMSRGSMLVLYSAAHREVIDAAPLGVAP